MTNDECALYSRGTEISFCNIPRTSYWASTFIRSLRDQSSWNTPKPYVDAHPRPRDPRYALFRCPLIRGPVKICTLSPIEEHSVVRFGDCALCWDSNSLSGRHAVCLKDSINQRCSSFETPQVFHEMFYQPQRFVLVSTAGVWSNVTVG
jgi:hypothetical protein